MPFGIQIFYAPAIRCEWAGQVFYAFRGYAPPQHQQKLYAMKRLFLLMILGIAMAAPGKLLAQGNTNVALIAAKEQHNQMLPDQYDTWKRSTTRSLDPIERNPVLALFKSGFE